ncbi:MAG: hypothetical protein ACO259_05705 [Bacteroidia bacterium]
MPITLKFQKPLDSQNRILRFGEEAVLPVFDSSVSINILFQQPLINALLNYNLDVTRGVTQQCGSLFEKSNKLGFDSTQQWEKAIHFSDLKSINHTNADKLKHAFSTLYEKGLPLKQQSDIVFTESNPLTPTNLSVDHEIGIPIKQSTISVFEETIKHIGDNFLGVHQIGIITNRETYPLKYQFAIPISSLYELPSGLAQPIDKYYKIPWDISRYAPFGKEPVVLPPQPPILPVDLRLRFLCKLLLISPYILRFGGTCELKRIPTRKVYYFVNHVKLFRVKDNIEVQFFGGSISGLSDRTTWCGNFNLNIAYKDKDKVMPDNDGNIILQLEINGFVFRFIAEFNGMSENWVYGNRTFSLTGRSITAKLAEPFAVKHSFVQTDAIMSRQLADAELARTDVDGGFSLDWQLIDPLGWQIPANAISFNEKTPLQVIKDIAEAAGGYVNSHEWDKILRVLPVYKYPYWEWATATPDKIIPIDLTVSKSTRYIEKPDYNGVYVSGERAGVNALVKRYLTQGDFLAPSIVSPYITDAAAARQKGIEILGGVGKSKLIGLETGINNMTGLIKSGMLLEIVEYSESWRGVVSSGMNINIGYSPQSGLDIKQRFEVERRV